MNILTAIFYQPILNVLVFLYNIIPGHDVGIAIIVITVLIKVILWPFTTSALRGQRAMQTLQPKLKAIQEQHKGDKEKLAKATMELYKNEKVSPLSSCLPLLVQLPFLWGLYKVLIDGLDASKKLTLLYPFVGNPGTIDPSFLGLMDLAQASIPLAVLAGAAQFWATKMIQVTPPAVAGSGAKDESAMASMNKSMMYTMPLITVVIGAKLPGGLTLYWLVTTLLQILQQWIFLKKKNEK